MSERLVPDLAGAVLDGAPIDWASVESSADAVHRPVVAELRILAALADVHRRLQALAPTVSDGDDGALTRWGHLRALERIGHGVFGEVYRAWDTRLDREVALKLTTAPAAASDDPPPPIIQEGKLLARVRHPNVVTIYGAEQIGDRIGLWMEFVRGRTLKETVDAGRLFTGAEAGQIGIALCHAVAAVHAAGVLHRDIKAQNVMLADDGRPVLMDFGTGRELADNGADVAGTPLYLAPEILGGGDATVQSDVYSLGVLLYYLVTGSYPVPAGTARDLQRAHQRNERIRVRTSRRGSDFPPKLARIIERAIDPQPHRRYASARALASDLATLQPRPMLARLPHAIVAAAILLLMVGLGWEAVGRRLGSSRTPGQLLAGVAGGNAAAAEPATPILERLTNDGNVRLAAVSADGRDLAYVRRDGVRESLWLKTHETATTTRLLEPGDGTFRSLTFAGRETLHYMFFRPDKTAVSPFRVSTRGGSPEALLEPAGRLSFNRDGSLCAYIATFSLLMRESRLIISDPDGNDSRIIAVRRPPRSFLLTTPAWAPDGTRLAVFGLSEHAPDALELLIVDVKTGATSSARPLDLIAIDGALWLPDGQHVVVSGRQRTAAPQRLWLFSVASATLRPLTHDLSDYTLAGLSDTNHVLAVRGEVARSLWTLDLQAGAAPQEIAQNAGDLGEFEGLAWLSGDEVLYTAAEDGNVDVWSASVSRRSRRRLTSDPGDEFHPSATADGETVVFASRRGDAPGIWTMNRDGTNRKRLTTGTDVRPSISRDGRMLVFQRGAVDTTPFTLWRLARGEATPTQVSDQHAMRPALSPDGESIAHYWMTLEAWLLAVTPTAGGPPAWSLPISETHAARVVRWSPDGRALAYIDGAGGASNIWLQPLDGGQARKLTNFTEGRISTFDWSPDGSRLVWMRLNEVRDVVALRFDARRQ